MSLILISFSGQLHTSMGHFLIALAQTALLSLVSVNIWGSHLLHGQFLAFLECLRGTLLETHSMDALVNIDSVFSGHHLVDGGPALLLSTLLCRSHFCRTGVQDYGRRNTVS